MGEEVTDPKRQVSRRSHLGPGPTWALTRDGECGIETKGTEIW